MNSDYVVVAVAIICIVVVIATVLAQFSKPTPANKPTQAKYQVSVVIKSGQTEEFNCEDYEVTDDTGILKIWLPDNGVVILNSHEWLRIDVERAS